MFASAWLILARDATIWEAKPEPQSQKRTKAEEVGHEKDQKGFKGYRRETGGGQKRGRSRGQIQQNVPCNPPTSRSTLQEPLAHEV